MSEEEEPECDPEKDEVNHLLKNLEKDYDRVKIIYTILFLSQKEIKIIYLVDKLMPLIEHTTTIRSLLRNLAEDKFITIATGKLKCKSRKYVKKGTHKYVDHFRKQLNLIIEETEFEKNKVI